MTTTKTSRELNVSSLCSLFEIMLYDVGVAKDFETATVIKSHTHKLKSYKALYEIFCYLI